MGEPGADPGYSTAVEHITENQEIMGSNPAEGAVLFKLFLLYFFTFLSKNK